MTGQQGWPRCAIGPANVSQVPQRSPLRYPGGKSWLVPHLRRWLRPGRYDTLLEPFAGGATATLTALAEDRVGEAVLVERDPDVAAFWRTALYEGPWLRARVAALARDPEAIARALAEAATDERTRGWRLLLRSRTGWSGNTSPGAGRPAGGERGRSTASRWYPETLQRRLEAVERLGGRIRLIEGDGVAQIRTVQGPGVAIFADPPYGEQGGRQPARRLYRCWQVDHAELFDGLWRAGCPFLMTSDPGAALAARIRARGAHCETVRPRTAHGQGREEWLVSRSPLFDEAGAAG